MMPLRFAACILFVFISLVSPSYALSDNVTKTEKTFAIIKPDAVSRGLIGRVLSKIEDKKFIIKDMRLVSIAKEEAYDLYIEHKKKNCPYYQPIVDNITSAPSVILLLEKKNAVSDLREIVGAFDPKKAEKGTIRQLFGCDNIKNTIHASTSLADAERESAIFFGKQ